jgi:sugar phosphate isomerase/epimerase
LPEIAALGAGIELGSYGLVGIQSREKWESRVALHQAVRADFEGTIAIHGPFVGIEYGHVDYLIREAINHRLDMTFDAATKLRASRVVLHGGYSPMVDLFKLQDAWLKTNIAFWQQEIRRWADAGIEIVLENDTDRSPGPLVRVVDEVDSPFLGLCMDIGHLHVFSELDAVEWLRRMSHRLTHVHLHDNDGMGDTHWRIGRGTIDFDAFYTELATLAPNATLALEVVDEMQVKLDDLSKLASRLATAARGEFDTNN